MNKQAYEMQLAILQAERDAAVGMVASLDNDLFFQSEQLDLSQIKLHARDRIIQAQREQIAALEEALAASDRLLFPEGELQELLNELFVERVDLK